MSWSSYTDNLVSCKVDMCGIHGTNGAPWAQVKNFECTPEEIFFVTQAIAKKDNNIYGTGAKIAGKNWTVIRLEEDDGVLVLKGKDPDNQKKTMVMALSGQAIVFGTSSDESVQGSVVREAIQKMRDYLKGCGY
ncbi:profilin-1-like [Babylonia areolata]|uniref:profilin-1-like n=1 Tax=Babylonia areolata TaxID=304850 RepID=UPI003FD17551